MISDTATTHQKRPRVSVAMATFNGERFIAEQLESILAQTLVPDEIVISDDGSTDSTLEIARTILEGAQVQWSIVANKYERGYSTNFSTSLEEATGDIVFLSDQDDIWFPEKIYTTLQKFDAPATELVVHDARILWNDRNENGPLVSDFLSSRSENPSNNIFGCMMSVRRSLLTSILPLTNNIVAHDVLLSFIATERDARVYLDVPLMKYRRHSGNVTQELWSPLKRPFSIPLSLSSTFDYRWLLRKLRQFRGYHTLLLRQKSKGINVLPTAAFDRLQAELRILELRYTSVLEGGPFTPIFRFAQYMSLNVNVRVWMKDSVAALARLHRLFRP